MAENFFIASDGLLGVRTNLSRLKWSFGAAMPPSTREAYARCAVRLRVEIDGGLSLPWRETTGNYHYFRGAPHEDWIAYDRPFLLGRRLRLLGTGLLGDEPTIVANPTYHRFVSHRFMNLHSLGYILTDLAGQLLLRRGYAPLHCSAFQIGDATVLVAAAPNTGKTLTAMMACIEHGARFLAEDLAITDGKTIYSVPWTSTFRYYGSVEQGMASRAHAWLKRWFPPLELIPPQSSKPITAYVDPDKMATQAPITHVVVLERGKPALERPSRAEAVRRVRNLNRYEFNYHKSPLVVAHEFFNPALDIAAACQAEQRILGEVVRNAAECFVVRTTNPKEYASMIMDAVQDGGASHPKRVAA